MFGLEAKVLWLFVFVALYWSYCIYWGIKGARQAKTAGDYFIVNGSVNGKGYGVNGVGGGKMPGFGAVLPESDIGLIVDYLRGLMPDA